MTKVDDKAKNANRREELNKQTDANCKHNNISKGENDKSKVYVKITKSLYGFVPKSNGKWSDERGNSIWIPDEEFVPDSKNNKHTNPQKKKWKDILSIFGITGITYTEGEPDFSIISKGNVEIDGFSIKRDKNFAKADIELAKQRNCTPEEVAKWRKENRYTWHEQGDCKTMRKVPSIVHNNMPHAGGISRMKKILKNAKKENKRR